MIVCILAHHDINILVYPAPPYGCLVKSNLKRLRDVPGPDIVSRHRSQTPGQPGPGRLPQSVTRTGAYNCPDLRSVSRGPPLSRYRGCLWAPTVTGRHGRMGGESLLPGTSARRRAVDQLACARPDPACGSKGQCATAGFVNDFGLLTSAGKIMICPAQLRGRVVGRKSCGPARGPAYQNHCQDLFLAPSPPRLMFWMRGSAGPGPGSLRLLIPFHSII
jgi:hypothetical protein